MTDGYDPTGDPFSLHTPGGLIIVTKSQARMGRDRTGRYSIEVIQDGIPSRTMTLPKTGLLSEVRKYNGKEFEPYFDKDVSNRVRSGVVSALGHLLVR